MIADILLVFGALGAAAYCLILSRRLKRFTDLESGVGGAIAVLSAQVDDMARMLEQARQVAQGSASRLEAVTERAEQASRRLELLMASLHDLPVEAAPSGQGPPPPGDELRGAGGGVAKRAAMFASSRRTRQEELG